MENRLYDLTNLEEYKLHLYKLIDGQAVATIDAGMTYDGLVFSMSTNAQINWSNFPIIPEGSFPIPINTIDDTASYLLTYANRLNFWGAALTCKNTALQTGNYKKGLVRACTTIEELDTLKQTLNL